MDKRKKDKYPHDFWDEFFGTSFNDFMKMRRNMEKIFHDAMRSFPEDELQKKPFIYGFSVRVGPNGVPHVQQFGNTKYKKGFGVNHGTSENEREPLTDIIEAEDHIAITMELPGVERDEINMDLVENSLVIDVDTKTRKYHKELDLLENLDFDSIEATCKNGVLDIVIKRKSAKAKKGRKINIK